MKKTDVDYMLTMSNLICKLEKERTVLPNAAQYRRWKKAKKKELPVS